MSDKKETVDVTHHDQHNINVFGRLNNQSHQIDSTIKDCRIRLEHLEEAGNELMLADDDESARYLVGESWLHIANDTAEERLQAETDTVTQEIEDLQSQQKDIAAQMGELKTELYAKFGKNINLEDHPEDE